MFTRSRSITWSSFCGSMPSISTTRPPRTMKGIDTSPAVCVMGAAASTVMRSVTAMADRWLAMVAVRLRWLSMTPLERPVVPPVPMIMASP